MTADILAKGLANYFKRITCEATELDELIRSLKTTDTSRVGERGKIVKIHELVEGVEYGRLGKRYKVSDGLLYVVDCNKDNWISSSKSYNEVQVMEFAECEFEPKHQDKYYYPCFETKDGYSVEYWSNYPRDNNIKRCVGIYRTKEQAIEKAKELGWME